MREQFAILIDAATFDRVYVPSVETFEAIFEECGTHILGNATYQLLDDLDGRVYLWLNGTVIDDPFTDQEIARVTAWLAHAVHYEVVGPYSDRITGSVHNPITN